MSNLQERELAGKVALVTGGSRGIGAAIAKRLAAEGASVALTYSKGADAATSVVEAIELVGGGDTAAEYVQYLRPQGNRVTLSYRKADFTRLNQQNHDALLAMERRGDVEILRNSNIKEIEDEVGRPRISFAEPEHTARTLDRVIFALGGTTPTNFLHTLGHYVRRRRPGVRRLGRN